MGKFLLGLILGVALGMVATTYNPNLPEDLQAALANLTALVMRGTERAAEAVGGAADRTAEEAREAAREAEREAPRQPGAVIREPTPENPPPASE
jgi:hypothetical protein